MPPLLTATALHPFNRQDIPTLLAHRAASRREHPFIVWEPFEGQAETYMFTGYVSERDRP